MSDDIFSRVHLKRQSDNQRRLLKEEIAARRTIGYAGGLFVVGPELIVFVDKLIDKGYTEMPVFDVNNEPVMISDLVEFSNILTEKYVELALDAYSEFTKINHRTDIREIVDHELQQYDN